MTSEFKVGDRVQLKSGGTVMTVTEIGEFEGRPTVWMSYTYRGKLKRTNQPPEALQHAEDYSSQEPS